MADTPTREELERLTRWCNDQATFNDQLAGDPMCSPSSTLRDRFTAKAADCRAIARILSTLPPAAAGGGWRGIETADTCPVCNGDCAGANPPVTFCPMKERVPKDGRRFLAAVAVYSGGQFLDWDVHVISVDDETGDIPSDAYQGWNLSDYTLWQPIQFPPHPDTEDGR